jgi:ribosomal protein L29
METVPELQKILYDSREKLRELKFKDANRQLKNVRELRSLKREIATILTLINQTTTPTPSK